MSIIIGLVVFSRDSKFIFCGLLHL